MTDMYHFTMFITLLCTVLWDSVAKNELLVLYHILISTVYTGGGDPHAQASPAYFCIAAQINPLRSQTASWAIYLQEFCQFNILHSSTKVHLLAFLPSLKIH